jgi:cytochrome c oxidase subunit IV
MWFNYLVLLTALVLSGTAAYYSIIGLTAIFSAAFWPIVIMGSVLEAGKVIASVWLHRYWSLANWQYKSYLVPAVVFLMLLTSMGIFGFLSKAHTDQNLVSGDVQSKIAVYDEKIKIAKENIDANRKALKQMDEAVDQIMGRSNDEKGADKAVALRRSQARERTRLQSEIQAEQKAITSLNEERAPIAADVRKVEAEVGPIKYIAALIYGDNPDQNILEKAVRWVIILIVFVFDPLAIALILASTQGMAWERLKRRQPEPTAYEPDNGPLTTEQLDAIQATAPQPVDLETINTELALASETDPDTDALIAELEELKNTEAVLVQSLEQHQDELELAQRIAEGNAKVITDQTGQITHLQKTLTDLEQKLSDTLEQHQLKVAELEENNEINTKKINQLRANLATLKDDSLAKDATIQELTAKKEELEAAILELGYAIQELEEKLATSDVEPIADPEPGPEPLPLSIIPELQMPSADAGLDITSRASNAGFGNTFPDNPEKGDMFVRVDVLPNIAYKFNGAKWIEVDKANTDTYLQNADYVKFLVAKLESGEVELDQLTEAEQAEVKRLLKKENVLGK